MQEIRISAPASSANLGPGFDCVGLALDIRNEFVFRYPADQFSVDVLGHSNADMTVPEKNLVIQTYLNTVNANQLNPVKFTLTGQNSIPLEGGMGSSATAILAGVAIARKIHGLEMNRIRLLNDALRMEAHPDNLSACLYGGLTISYLDGNNLPVVYPINPPQPPTCYVIHPHASVNTTEARKTIQKNIPLKKVVENMARLSITTSAWIEGKYDYLFDSMMDNIHEPFRMNPTMDYPALKKKLRSIDFYGWAISGSGPSVIIFCRNVTDAMRNCVKTHFGDRGIAYDEFFPAIDVAGLTINGKRLST